MLALISFVGFLSYTNSLYYICDDFNIRVDVGYKFMTFLYSCDWSQRTHLHDHRLDLILLSSDQDTIVDVKICDFLSDYALVKYLVAFPIFSYSSSSYSK